MQHEAPSKSTLFVVLHDSNAKRYDVLATDNATAESLAKLTQFLQSEKPDDIKYFWTVVAKCKPIRPDTSAPVIRRYLEKVNISWIMAKRDVCKRSAEILSEGFGFDMQEYTYVDYTHVPVPILSIKELVDEFMRPRAAKRARTENTPTPSANPN